MTLMFLYLILVLCPKQVCRFFLSVRIILIAFSIRLFGSILNEEKLFVAWVIGLGSTNNKNVFFCKHNIAVVKILHSKKFILE